MCVHISVCSVHISACVYICTCIGVPGRERGLFFFYVTTFLRQNPHSTVCVKHAARWPSVYSELCSHHLNVRTFHVLQKNPVPISGHHPQP